MDQRLLWMLLTISYLHGEHHPCTNYDHETMCSQEESLETLIEYLTSNKTKPSIRVSQCVVETVFSDIFPDYTKQLTIASSKVLRMTEGAFRNLHELQELTMYENSIDTLQDGVFNGITSLEVSWLKGSQNYLQLI